MSHIIIQPSSCNTKFDVALIRHPRPVVPPATCYGRREVRLAAGWQDWALSLAPHLAGLAPTRIWSSPASRCALVAEHLAQRLATPRTLDDSLLELDFGAWEGVRWDEVPRQALDRWASDPLGFAAPGGETGHALIARIEAFAGRLREQSLPCIVVSHGGPLRLLRALLRGEPPDLLAVAPGLGRLEIVRSPGRADIR